jgi:hypothetical protein
MEPKPLEPAAVLAIAGQADEVLSSSLNSLMGPTVLPAGLEALELLTGLDPDGAPPSIEGCAPMPEGVDMDGDGYPALQETLTIDCSFLVFELTGTLVLMDGDDTDPASGFHSTLNYRLTITDEGGPMTQVGERGMQVRKAAAGSGYDLMYAGIDVIEGVLEVRMAYTGSLQGTFASGMLAIAGGSFELAPPPVAGQRQPALPGSSLKVQAARLDYDSANCATVLTGGGVNLTNEAGEVIGISYEGCGVRSVTYNGEPLPPAPA